MIRMITGEPLRAGALLCSLEYQSPRDIQSMYAMPWNRAQRTLRVEKMISLMVSEGSVSAPACHPK